MGFFEDFIASLQGFVQNEPSPGWKYRNDPVFGGGISVDPLEQYSGPNITDTRAKLYRDAVERMGGKEALMGDVPEEEGSWFSRTPLGQDLAKYTVDGKIQLPFEPGPAIAGIAEKRVTPGDEAAAFAASGGVDPMRARALEAISARESEQEQVAKEASKEAAKQRLLEAAGAEKQQREFMQGTIPLVEDYDKRIAIGGDPKRGGREELLAKIRAQALAKGGGTVGAGGGTFSQGTMTPEIESRIAERDAWAADQPMRDLEFALTPGQMRMRPQGAVAAAELLPQMQQNRLLTGRQKLQERLISELADGAGKIPFEKSQELIASGFDVPPFAIGASKEEGISDIDRQIAALQNELMKTAEKINNYEASEMDILEGQFGRTAMMKLNMYRNMLEEGRITPDEAQKLINETIRAKAAELQGVLQYQLRGNQVSPQPAGE